MLEKYVNEYDCLCIMNGWKRGSSYMDILVNRTRYMSCQAGPGVHILNDPPPSNVPPVI